MSEEEGAAPNAGLVPNPIEVTADARHRDVHPFADVDVGESFGKPFQKLDLPL